MAEGFKIADSYVEIDAEINKSQIRASAASAGDDAGRTLARHTTDSAGKGFESERGRTQGFLRKMVTPSSGAFAALRAPFAAALSTPIGGAVIAVAGIAALAFIGAFAAALATAGLGAVFLGIGAAALLGAKKDRDAAEKDLEKAEERVRKAEQRAKSGSAASKRNLAEATKALADAQEAVNNTAAFEKMDSSLDRLGATIQRVGAQAAAPLMKPLTEAFDSLNKTVITLGPMLREIFTALAPVIPALTAGISGFVTEFLKVLTADPAVLQGMKDTLIAIADNLPRLGTALGQMFALFATNENNVRNIGLLFDLLVLSIANLAAGVTFLSLVLDYIVAGWTKVINAIKIAVSWITGTAVPAITGAWNSIISGGGRLLAWFQALPGRIIAFLQSLPSRARSLFVQMFDFITTAIGFGIGTVIRLMLTLPGKIVSAVASIPSRIASIFNSAKSLMSSIASSAVSAAVSIFTTLPGKAASAISAIRSRIQGVFSGAGSWLVSAGRAIVEGVAKGIVGAMGGAIAAAKRAAQNIANGFKSALGIKSPSELMAKQVGKPIMQGIGVGIKRNVRAAAPDVRGLPSAVMNGVAPVVNVAPTPVHTSGGTVNVYNTFDASKIKSLGDAVRIFELIERSARTFGATSGRTAGLGMSR